MLTRDEILGKSDLPREELNVPELGGSVFVRVMTAGERDRWEERHLKDGLKDFRARLAAATVCDASGKLLFTEADVPALGRLSSAPLTRIAMAAKRLNVMEEGDVEDLEKKSGTAPSGASSSGSP